MKKLKQFAVKAVACCLLLVAAGCSGNKNTPSGESVTSEIVSETSETAEVLQVSHVVTVEEYLNVTMEDPAGEYTSTYPKLIVDGKEASEINALLCSYLQNAYPMEKDGEYVDGYITRYTWGVKDNTVSFVFYMGVVSEDYFNCEVFNYDLDTLTELDDSEVVKRFGMTDDEFFSKTADVYRDYCSGKMDFDLDKSLAAINYDKITPYITPDGNPGVAGSIYYAYGSQFSGLESVIPFEL